MLDWMLGPRGEWNTIDDSNLGRTKKKRRRPEKKGNSLWVTLLLSYHPFGAVFPTSMCISPSMQVGVSRWVYRPNASLKEKKRMFITHSLVPCRAVPCLAPCLAVVHLSHFNTKYTNMMKMTTPPQKIHLSCLALRFTMRMVSPEIPNVVPIS